MKSNEYVNDGGIARITSMIEESVQTDKNLGYVVAPAPAVAFSNLFNQLHQARAHGQNFKILKFLKFHQNFKIIFVFLTLSPKHQKFLPFCKLVGVFNALRTFGQSSLNFFDRAHAWAS